MLSNLQSKACQFGVSWTAHSTHSSGTWICLGGGTRWAPPRSEISPPWSAVLGWSLTKLCLNCPPTCSVLPRFWTWTSPIRAPKSTHTGAGVSRKRLLSPMLMLSHSISACRIFLWMASSCPQIPWVYASSTPNGTKALCRVFWGDLPSTHPIALT